MDVLVQLLNVIVALVLLGSIARLMFKLSVMVRTINLSNRIKLLPVLLVLKLSPTASNSRIND